MHAGNIRSLTTKHILPYRVKNHHGDLWKDGGWKQYVLIGYTMFTLGWPETLWLLGFTSLFVKACTTISIWMTWMNFWVISKWRFNKHAKITSFSPFIWERFCLLGVLFWALPQLWHLNPYDHLVYRQLS